MKKLLTNDRGYVVLRGTNNPALFSDDEKSEALSQNQLVREACEEFNIIPYCVSRDKEGHILVLEYRHTGFHNTNYPTFFCYCIGMDVRTKKLTCYVAGIIDFVFSTFARDAKTMEDYMSLGRNCLEVQVLSVHDAFHKLGIGRILIQAAENYAAENGLKYMTVSSLKAYDMRQGRMTPPAGIMKKLELLKHDITPATKYVLTDAPLADFVGKTFFDKNYYFYSTCGFKDLESDGGMLALRNLVKRGTAKCALDFGGKVSDPTVSPESEIFSIRNEIGSAVINAINHRSRNLFPAEANSIYCGDFSPLVVQPTPQGTLMLTRLLTDLDYRPCRDEVYSANYIFTSNIEPDPTAQFSDLCSYYQFDATYADAPALFDYVDEDEESDDL